MHSLAPAGKITTGSPQRARRAAATIEAALMAQHGLSVVELRASLWDTLRMAFAPAVSVVPTSRRVGRLLRGEAPAVED